MAANKFSQFCVLAFAATNAKVFIEFWSAQYLRQNKRETEDLYDNNIGKPFVFETLEPLFIWKNGSKLSRRKKISVERYLKEIELISADADLESLREFLRRPGGAIWRIFWLHIQHPRRFPIYDQHAHRAMAHLRGWSILEIDSKDVKKIDYYLDEYLPFVSALGQFPLRAIDQAMWAYGRFLSLGYKLDLADQDGETKTPG